MLTELDVVNSCLATIGEMPLVELSDDHPLIAAARQNFQEAIVSETARQWWFNTDYCILQQANDKFVYVPGDAIAVTPLDRLDLTMRGRRLYDRTNSTYEVTGPVRCWVIRNLIFDELPAPAQLLVKHSTVLQFQMNYDADESKTQKLEALYTAAYRTLNAEHTRQIRLNALNQPQIAMMRMRAGVRPRRSGHFAVR